MEGTRSLNTVPDDELLRRLTELLRHSRRVEADLVAHIGEVDARRLYAREASPSMFVYCTQALHLSEFEAYLRITVARAARLHPVLLEMLKHANATVVEVLAGMPRGERTTTEPLTQTPQQLAGVAGHVGPVAAARPRPARVEPLSPARYKIEFTAGVELRDKLERLKALLRSSVPDGDLAALIELAVTEKLERLEAKRFGRTNVSRKAPRKLPARVDTTARSRHVPAAVRRAVYERDGGRCSFVDDQGRRCTARDGLEFHHRRPFGHGGEHSLANISLQCRGHNNSLAEVDYGREAMERHITGAVSSRRASRAARAERPGPSDAPNAPSPRSAPAG